MRTHYTGLYHSNDTIVIGLGLGYLILRASISPVSKGTNDQWGERQKASLISERWLMGRIDFLFEKKRIKTKSHMNDQTKLALFDALLAFLIQSSTAMEGTIKALASGALVSPLVLNEAIDSAKVLLSKVIYPSINLTLLDCFSFVL
jgi:hypothetical protein